MQIYCNKTLLKKAQFSQSTEIVFNDRYIKKIEGKHIHLMVYELNILYHSISVLYIGWFKNMAQLSEEHNFLYPQLFS
mgnify:FL=1